MTCLLLLDQSYYCPWNMLQRAGQLTDNSSDPSLYKEDRRILLLETLFLCGGIARLLVE